MIEIDDTLEAMQGIVGGLIEEYDVLVVFGNTNYYYSMYYKLK